MKTSRSGIITQIHDIYYKPSSFPHHQSPTIQSSESNRKVCKNMWLWCTEAHRDYYYYYYYRIVTLTRSWLALSLKRVNLSDVSWTDRRAVVALLLFVQRSTSLVGGGGIMHCIRRSEKESLYSCVGMLWWYGERTDFTQWGSRFVSNQQVVSTVVKFCNNFHFANLWCIIPSIRTTNVKHGDTNICFNKHSSYRCRLSLLVPNEHFMKNLQIV